jgi:predicted ribosomally synthesized peptide with nif11-like leader
MNFKEFTEKISKDEAILRKINAAPDVSKAYEISREFGFSGTEEEFRTGLKERRNQEILDQELSKEDLVTVQGGINPNCETTYEAGENCDLTDSCNYFFVYYDG